MPPQLTVPAVYMRGGTSRAVMFRAEHLPADQPGRDAIMLACLGSPDPNRRQLDGLGGALSSLSKVAIIGPPSRPDADVDYTFGQVAIDAPVVSWRGNCGNISSAVGPYALDEGLVTADGPTVRVRIHNTNTGKIIVAEFATEDGQAAVDGDFVLQGVAGTGAPIRLAFLEPAGAVTGRLLPTGVLREWMELPGLRLEVSMVDAANPVVFAAASDFGLSGAETPGWLEAQPDLLARLEALRIAASLRMGIAPTEAAARLQVRNLPQIGLLTRSNDPALHIRVQMISAGQPHRATPLTGAMCLAVAARLPGTVPHAMAQPVDAGADMMIGHPSGRLPVAATIDAGPEPLVREAVVYRTARRLMQGAVLVPRSRLSISP